MRSTLFFSLALTFVSALPTFAAPVEQNLVERQTRDAPFSVPVRTLQDSITCPYGIQGRDGGVVLLVHGTGYTGKDAWELGPYVKLLPLRGPGFDVCWITLPNRSLSDAQISAEYIAYNIPRLAAQSKTKKIAIIGHSQGGGLNIQWALTFWPSTRRLVTDYIALAGDFHGSAAVDLSCLPNITTCNPAVWQQQVKSKYLAAQNFNNGGALVTTTSIYTIYDEVLLNNFFDNGRDVRPTSVLAGATNIRLQADNVCGLFYVADHFLMLGDPATFLLALSALTRPGGARLSDITKLDCLYVRDNVYLSDIGNNLLRFQQGATAAIATLVGSAKAEPPLKQYVCDAGRATQCG